jgi:thiamine-phosphate pyrophosphorylase
MTARQRPWPRAWLMTDERMGERLWGAIARLPDGEAGLVFRHYSLQPDERRVLGERIATTCRQRNLTLAVASDVLLARALDADLVHNPDTLPGDLPFSRSVHSLEEAEAARSEGAVLVFVSPVSTTRSHPDQPPLGRDLARRIAQAASAPAIALGGMSEQHFTQFAREGFYGWAGIDAWLE